MKENIEDKEMEGLSEWGWGGGLWNVIGGEIQANDLFRSMKTNLETEHSEFYILYAIKKKQIFLNGIYQFSVRFMVITT